MSGHWPPEWDDHDEADGGEADHQDAEAAARLSAVSAFLAAAPAPVLPPGVEARISAAIAAEAAARPATDRPATDRPATDRPATDRNVWPRILRRPPGRARVRRQRDPHRMFLVGGSAAVVCLVLAGFAFLLSHSSGSSSSSRAASGSAAGPASSSAASSTAGSVPEAGPASGGQRISAAGPAAPRPASTAPFTVIASGTAYHQATLAAQVRSVLARPAGRSGSAAGRVPSAQLLGCVERVTNAPTLVDQATYQGTPAYVIASRNRVWVVGPGCQVSDPDIIVSVPLTGLPGNLRALVSVKREA